jgi:hypothetical protein
VQSGFILCDAKAGQVCTITRYVRSGSQER